MRILEEFWYGNVTPNDRTFSKNSRLAKLMSLLTKNENDLLKSLNAAEKELFEKYRDNQDELIQLSDCEIFISGFRLGAQIMLEVMNDTDCPFIDDSEV